MLATSESEVRTAPKTPVRKLNGDNHQQTLFLNFDKPGCQDVPEAPQALGFISDSSRPVARAPPVVYGR